MNVKPKNNNNSVLVGGTEALISCQMINKDLHFDKVSQVCVVLECSS